MENFESLSCDSVCAFLKERVPSILEKIKDHRIDGEVFFALNDEYLREVAPLLGDRLKIKIITTVSSTVSKGIKRSKIGGGNSDIDARISVKLLARAIFATYVSQT